jgi:5-methylcytosine-specific restriction endonuclease McrA
MSVLVLNASYEPMHVVSVRRAVVLLLKEKAQLVEAAESVLRSQHVELPTPVVIRLVTYIRIRRRWNLPVSRRGVLARDGYTCQYCGAQPGKRELTIDHVVPRSKGGTKTWENLVTACGPCNRRKGDRDPRQAGMKLSSRPRQPRYFALALIETGTRHSVWSKYLEPYRPRSVRTAPSGEPS